MERRLAARLAEIGFSCTRCGDCCRAGDGDDNLVMVSHAEIEKLSACSGLHPRVVAEPYPGSRDISGNVLSHFGKVVRRVGGDCRFYAPGLCAAYPVRPWICRTYPFLLEGNELVIFPCRGIGRPIGEGDALALARDLIARRAAEQEEEEMLREACGRTFRHKRAGEAANAGRVSVP